MPLSALCTTLILAASFGLGQGHPSLSSKKQPVKESIDTNNATAFTIIYGYPLTLFAQSFGSVISSIGANAIFHEPNTATAGNAAIVRPNVDTLYSKVAVDLSQSDVALTIPEVNDGRFYLIPFYDLWSNNFANLGSLNATAPGKYLMKYTEDVSQVGFQTAEDECEYLGVINFPTTYGMFLPRILLRNNSTDLAIVHQIQAGIKVEEVARNTSSSAPSLTTALLGNGTLEPLAYQYPSTLNQSSVQRLLQVLARLAPYNMPADPQEAVTVEAYFEAAGLENGQYTPPPAVNFTMANQLINVSLEATTSLSESYGNGWKDYQAQYSGSYHKQYAVRAIIAFSGYLQLVQAVTLYPEWFVEGNTMYLTANQSFIITFPSGKPPIKGFWSITAYNSSSYLVPNPLNRYALGDRSNLTYPDGSQVYANSSSNGAFSILVQPADLPPTGNWTDNWLPAPAGGGNFTLNLRFYGPEQPLLAGETYMYPIVTKQDAIGG